MANLQRPTALLSAWGLATAIFVGCSGAPKPEPAAPEQAHSAPVAASASTPPAASAKPPVDDDPHVDPHERAEPIALEVVMPKGLPKSKFPKATTSDGECWRSVGLTGKHAQDFAALVEKCGAPTGMVEYAKPVEGKLHHAKDKRDTYTVKLRAGHCYRFFAVAEGETNDIDILVTTATGALVADDRAKGSVVIVHGDKPWCFDEETDYQYHLEVKAPGKGGYLFGVWARPKKLAEPRSVASQRGRAVHIDAHSPALLFQRERRATSR